MTSTELRRQKETEYDILHADIHGSDGQVVISRTHRQTGDIHTASWTGNITHTHRRTGDIHTASEVDVECDNLLT